MKKVLLIVLGFFLLSGHAFGQPFRPAANSQLVVRTLMDYGTMLYDRRDYDQARVIFNRVLQYEPTHPQALSYLNKIRPTQGEAIERKAKYLRVKKKITQVKKITEITPEPVSTPATVTKFTDTMSVEDLRQRIRQKEQAISALKAQLDHEKTRVVDEVKPYNKLDDANEFNAYLDTLRHELNQIRQDVDKKNKEFNLN